MKTFIWADESQSFSEYEFFVAVADSLDEARILVIKQLGVEEEQKIQIISKDWAWNPNWKEDNIQYLRQENSKIVKEIMNREPSHILSAGTAMVIHHGNQ